MLFKVEDWNPSYGTMQYYTYNQQTFKLIFLNERGRSTLDKSYAQQEEKVVNLIRT